VVPPTTPKEVTFPLSDEDFHKLYAAAGTHGGLMKWVKENSKAHDLKSPDTRNSLRQKTTDNQEEVRKLLVKAVLAGKTLQQARVGLLIAQFEALPADFQKKALADGKARMARQPGGWPRDAGVAKHNDDLQKLKELKTDKEKEEWVNKQYSQGTKVSQILQ